MSRLTGISVVAALLCAVFLAPFAHAADRFEDLVANAQTAVDTWRPDVALTLFDKAATLAPDRAGAFNFDRAWAYVEKGYSAYCAGTFDQAAADFSKATEACPAVKPSVAELWACSRLTVFWMMLSHARAVPHDADWQALSEYAEETLAIEPEWPETHYALATAYELAGRIDDARAEYRDAVPGVDAPPAIESLRTAAYQAAISRKYVCAMPRHPLLASAAAGPFDVARHGRMILHHHNAELAERAARAIDYYLSQPVLDGVLEGQRAMPGECNVFIYRDHQELAPSRKLSDWAIGYFLCAISRKGVSRLELHLQQDVPDFLESSVPHELAHLRLRTRWRENPLPLWIHEGVAISAEPKAAQAFYRAELTAAAGSGTLVPVGDVMRLKAAPDDSTCGMYYAESAAMVNSLVERGGSLRFLSFLRALSNTGQRQALTDVYGLTPEELEQLAIDWASEEGPLPARLLVPAATAIAAAPCP